MTNYILFSIPFLIAIITQFIKFTIAIIKGKGKITELWAYGGMPSSHASICTSLMTLVYLMDGLGTSFTISAVFTFIVIRDAVGLRQEIAAHSKLLAKLSTDEKSTKTLDKRVGHTTFQVAVGAILGVLFTVGLYYLVV
jgi:uncharacterized protein